MPLYLDNAATSYPKPESVYQAVIDTMRMVGASPGRGGYAASLEASRLLFAAREAVAGLFAISDSSRIIFTHNATEALNLGLRGILKPNDHVITTSMEHNSMIRPLVLLQQNGIEVTTVAAGQDGCIDPEKIRQALTPRTRMIAMIHTSNVSGSVQPIAAIGIIAREAGICFLVDAAQSAGHEDIDVTAMGIDVLAAPGHKGLYGPQGTGFLYVGSSITLQPLLAGGTGSNSSSELQPTTVPDGYEVGTHNLPGIAGLMAGIEFVEKQTVKALRSHERTLISTVIERLSQIPGIKIHGPRSPELRSGVVSFTLTGVDASTVAFELDQRYQIAVRSGLHCAPRAHQTLGTFPGGTVRLSPGFFTTMDDIVRCCDAVEQLSAKLHT